MGQGEIGKLSNGASYCLFALGIAALLSATPDASAAADAQALSDLAALVRQHPEDPELQWAYAHALFEAGQLEEAVETLRGYQERWPKRRSDSALVLGRWLYAQKAYAKAAEELTRAIARQPQSGEAHLYLGLALTQLQEPENAARHFTVAAQLSPALRADATLLAALARNELGDGKGGEALLQRVVQLDPESEPARYARLILGPSGRPLSERMHLELFGGLGFDSNVPLQSDFDLAAINDDEMDGQRVWGALLSGELWRGARARLHAGARYQGTSHFQLDEYDTQRISGYATAMHALPRSLWLRLDGLMQYATLGGDPYVLDGIVRANLLADLGGRLGLTRVFGEFEVIDYDERPLFASLDRDAFAYGAGIEHVIPLPIREREHRVKLTTSYQRVDTQADRDLLGFRGAYDRNRWRVGLSFLASLPYRLSAELRLAGGFDRYENRNILDLLASGTTRTRSDDSFEAELRMRRPLTSYLDAELSYGYAERSSNIAVYDYDRHKVGMLLRVYPVRWWEN